MGIGVTIAWDNQQPMQGWTLQERGTGHKLIDEIGAIKLVLSKAVMQNWEKVEVQIQSKQVLNLIWHNKPQDMRLSTVLEDISHLKPLFHMCSFCLVSKDSNYLSNRISAFALDINQNE